MLNGEILDDEKSLSDCGVQEGVSLDFEVKASEMSLVRQLGDLLQARDLSTNELGMLYCYKHGVHINLAMKMIGHEGKLADFLQKQKGLSLDNGRVALKREDSALKPFSVTDEGVQILESGSGAMDIKDLKAAFVQKFNASLVSIAGMKPMDFLAKHKDVFTVNGRFVSLKGADIEQESLEKTAPVAPPPGLEAVVEQGPVDREYLDLHQEICGDSFDSKTAQALGQIADAISQVVFLNVDHIVKGGSVGKGTAIPGASDAELVFFLEGMQVIGDSLRMKVQGLITVDVRFSPVFQSYAKIIKSLGEQGLEARRFFTTTLAKESTLFISQQPKAVKVTIQLLKWWRDQQNWSDSIMRPTNEMLELMAVYSAVQTKPADQRTAIANVMALLSQFSELRIVWSNYYSKDDVWAPLLRQRPLLMDPTNPFVNVADAQSFDSTELMSFASSTHFFW